MLATTWSSPSFRQHLTLPDVDVDMGTSCCRCKSGSRASSEANLCSTACVVFSRVDQPTYDFRRASSLEAPCFILQRVFNLIQCVACSMPRLLQTPNRRSFLIPEVVIHLIIDIIGVILPVIPPVSFFFCLCTSECLCPSPLVQDTDRGRSLCESLSGLVRFNC